MIFNDRSKTRMDSVSQFTPGALAGRGVSESELTDVPTGVMNGLGQDFFDMYAPTDSGVTYSDPATAWPTDTGWGRTPSFAPETGFSMDNALKTASQWFSTLTQFDAQRKLMNLNLERAKAGLQPISPAAIAPQVNVGVAPGTLLAGGGGLLMLAAAALGVALISRGGGRGSRRRRR
jgi:hypothetical protein